ncbi:MAG: hypothetical protein HY720_30230 [Planctomycetes bacterium]|nr:hypothetical protein [Planctomycetota bacterium]
MREHARSTGSVGRWTWVGPFVVFFGVLSAVPARAERLLVGTQGGPFGKGHLWEREGQASWRDLSAGVDIGQAVMSVVEEDGVLYLGTQTRSGYGGWGGSGQVWRYDGSWTKVGQLDSSVMVLLLLKGRLYAGTNRQKLYRYEDAPGRWTLVASSYGSGFRAGVVANLRGEEEAFLGELNQDTFYRYGERGGLAFMSNYARSCVYGMTFHNGAVYGACWHGSWYRSTDGERFQQMGILGSDHLWALASFKGELYIGSGRGDCTSPGRLRAWDGKALRIVREFPATKYAEGVTALAKSPDGSRLYIGLGMNDGYYSGDGKAELWTYDGKAFSPLSAPDFFGGGVQSVLSFEEKKSAPKLSVECVGPTVLEPGGVAMAMLSVEDASGDIAESALEWELPAGWTVEPLDGPSNGRPRFAAAIVSPSNAAPGVYTVRARYAGSDWLVLEFQIVDKLLGGERASYVQSQSAIRQIRAWDRNLEHAEISAAMPAALDLTSQGIEGEQVVRRTPMEGHVLYRTVMESGGKRYESFLRWETAYAYLLLSNTGYVSSTRTLRYQREARVIFRAESQIPGDAVSVSRVGVEFKTGAAGASGTYRANRGAIALEPSAGLLAFNAIPAAATGAFVLSPYQQVSASLDGVFDGKGVLRLGMALDPNAVPFRETRYKLDAYQVTDRSAWIYTTWGTRPDLVLEYLKGQTPLEALRIALDLYCEGEVVEANELATYLNENFGHTIGWWGLAPGQTSGNGGRGQVSGNGGGRGRG